MTQKTCANDWCTRPLHAKGFCGICYRRGWAAGDMARAEIRYENWGQSRANVDEVVVERLCAGDIPDETTLGERETAVRRLHARGWNDVEIGARIHRRPRYVMKVRHRLGLPANQRGPHRVGEVYLSAADRRGGAGAPSLLLPHPWIAEQLNRPAS